VIRRSAFRLLLSPVENDVEKWFEKSQMRPVELQRSHAGFPSSHFMRRTLVILVRHVSNVSERRKGETRMYGM
jgi:hypothetical protein